MRLSPRYFRTNHKKKYDDNPDGHYIAPRPPPHSSKNGITFAAPCK